MAKKSEQSQAVGPRNPDRSEGMPGLNVFRWLLGYGSGLVGSQVYYIGLAWTATQIATPAMVGVILAAGSVPRALLLLLGGAIADRYGPKIVAVWSDVARIAVTSFLIVLAVTDRLAVPALVVVAVIFGVIDAVFLPAAGSMPPHIVKSEYLNRVQAMRSLLQRLAMVTGPPLAGWLLVQAGEGAVFSAAAAAFAVSISALVLTRVTPPDNSTKVSTTPPIASSEKPGLATKKLNPSLFRESWAGLRYVLRHPVLRPTLVIVAVAELAVAGPITAGLPLLSEGQDWGAQGMGFILASFGFGATISALYITVAGGLPHAGLVALAATILMGPLLTAVGLAGSVSAAAIFGSLTGICGGICGTLISTFVLAVSDSEYLGRVVSLMTFASFGGTPVAYLMTGLISSWASPSTAFVIGGILVSCVGVVGLCVAPIRSSRVLNTRSEN